MNTVNIAVLGLAHVHAEVYIRCIRNNPHAKLLGIWDSDPLRLAAECERFDVPFTGTLEELLEQKPQLVVVCSENARHAALVVAAAQRGIPVLCEKPLGTNREDMRTMIEVCKANDVGLMTAFPNRFLDTVRRVRDTIRSGALGELLTVKATNRGKMPGGFFIEPELSGGGSMMDHIVHVTDLLNWFLDEVPQWVHAMSDTRFYPELKVEDAAMVQMRYPCGLAVMLDASWSLCQKNPGARDLTMDIVGTKGSLSLDIVEGHNELLSVHTDRRLYFDLGEDKSQRMVDAAIACVIEGTPFPITGEDGYRAAVAAFAALESTGSTEPVQVQL